MATKILTASVAPVPIGHIQIEGLLASDGKFYPIEVESLRALAEG